MSANAANSRDLVNVRTTGSMVPAEAACRSPLALHSGPPAGRSCVHTCQGAREPSICSWLSVSWISWALSISSLSAQHRLAHNRSWLNHTELGYRPTASGCPYWPRQSALQGWGSRHAPAQELPGFRSGEKLSGTSPLH